MTPTGRKPSKPPTQNTPIRTPEGRSIRDAFRRPLFLRADFSAIEIRIAEQMVAYEKARDADEED